MSSNNKKSRKEKSGFSYYKLFDSAGGSASRMGVNKFVNDGSFLETFKKRAESSVQNEVTSVSDEKCEEVKPLINTDSGYVTPYTTEVETSEKSTSVSVGEAQLKKAPILPLIGKRRGGKVLPTGAVKKQRKEEEEEQASDSRTDAWSHYMKEVKRYQQQSCEDEGKTRPLVK